MSDALGTLAKAAMKKDAGLSGGGAPKTYPQTPGASDMSSGHQIPFTQETMTKGITRSRDPSLTGAMSIPDAPIVAEPVGGTLTGRLRYRGFERLIAYALGFELPNGDDGSPRLIGTGEGTKAVTNATNATPIVVTVTSHGYSNGDGIRIAGVGGNTAANGDWAIANVAASTFELVDSSGNGAYTSGGTAEKYNAAKHVIEADDALQHYPWESEDGRDAGFDADDRKVRSFQLGLDKQVSDWVFGSCMVSKLTISGNPNEVTIAADLIGYSRARGSYNSTNWALLSGSESQALFRQLEVKLGARAGGEGGLAIVRPNAFELSIDNKLKGDDQTTASGLSIEQPVRDGFRETRLKLDFPRYSSDLKLTWFDASTELAAKMVFSGAAIPSSGGELYKLGFFFSSMRVDEDSAAISGPGRVPESIVLVAERPNGSNIFTAGNWSTVSLKKDSEVVFLCQNEDPQNYLTEY